MSLPVFIVKSGAFTLFERWNWTPSEYTVMLSSFAYGMSTVRFAGVGAVPPGRLLRWWCRGTRGRRSPAGPSFEPCPPGARLGGPLGSQSGRVGGLARVRPDRGAPPDEFMRAFMRLNVMPGVEPPPPPSGDPPPWMSKRPGGISAFMETFRTYDLDRAALARFDRPVYFALGGRSNPDQYGEIATRLSWVFPDFQLEVFEERHHFDPPHRIEAERLAGSLSVLWHRAEQAYPL